MFSILYTSVLVCGYNLIPGVVIQRPFTISNGLSTDHVSCIKDAISEFNSVARDFDINTRVTLLDQCTPDRLCNTISYGANNDSLGYTSISGFYANTDWYIEQTNIYISSLVPYHNTCYNIILHELLHSKGLHHSTVVGSIMNNSISTYPDGRVYDMDKWNFVLDDLIGLLVSTSFRLFYFMGHRIQIK